MNERSVAKLTTRGSSDRCSDCCAPAHLRGRGPKRTGSGRLALYQNRRWPENHLFIGRRRQRGGNRPLPCHLPDPMRISGAPLHKKAGICCRHSAGLHEHMAAVSALYDDQPRANDPAVSHSGKHHADSRQRHPIPFALQFPHRLLGGSCTK